MSTPPSMPPRTTKPPATNASPPASKFSVSSGVSRKAFDLGIYGPEGIGKSNLASLCPGIVFADLESGTADLNIKRVDGIIVPDNYATSWANLRAWVQSLKSGIYAIDSVTRAEDWCAAWVIKNKKSNMGEAATDSLEDFKYKAGLQFIVDEFRRFLGDIDNARLRGVSFVLIAHNRVNRIKNPDGSDFIRHEPRLLDDPKGSNMLQFVQFLDHLLFVNLTFNADKGKVKDGGVRQIFFDTHPSRLSKTRSLALEPMFFDLDPETGQPTTELWKLLGVEK